MRPEIIAINFKRLNARGKVFIETIPAKKAPLIQAMAESAGEALKLIRFEAAEQAHSAPAPFTTYSFFDNGRFVTNEILSESKFTKYLEGKGL